MHSYCQMAHRTSDIKEHSKREHRCMSWRTGVTLRLRRALGRFGIWVSCPSAFFMAASTSRSALSTSLWRSCSVLLRSSDDVSMMGSLAPP